MLNIRKSPVAFAVAGIIGLTGLSAANAQQPDKPKDAVLCLKTDRIQDVEVIDNTHIVFRSGVNDYYLNTLPYNCNGLKLNDKIMYDASVNQLCNVDTVKVLDSSGPGLSSTNSCGLGYFQPITKEEIKALKESLRETKPKAAASPG